MSVSGYLCVCVSVCVSEGVGVCVCDPVRGCPCVSLISSIPATADYHAPLISLDMPCQLSASSSPGNCDSD